jgi:uncharacterized protein YbaR (Trm112 family)
MTALCPKCGTEMLEEIDYQRGDDGDFKVAVWYCPECDEWYP